MMGNEAIARGAFEAGATVAAGYPGTPSTEILENFRNYEGVQAQWAPNEKVAMEVAAGSSFAGARTLVTMKHVGVNVAADPLFTLAYTGVNGGLVFVSADDPAMYSSQNEQDNRGYGLFAKLPVLEPSNSQEALEFTRAAFALSEQFDAPVMLRTTTRLAHSQTMVEVGEPEKYELKEYVKNPAKYIMLPAYAIQRHVEVEKKMEALAAYAETASFNRIEWGDKKIGVIVAGIDYEYVKQTAPEVSVLKLGLTNPLPKKLIQSFAAEVERLIVVEELEPVIETQVKAWGIPVEGKNLFTRLGEYSPELIAHVLAGKPYAEGYGVAQKIPGRPPMLCPGCPHRGVFVTLRKLKMRVCGDIGCYTLGALSPLEALDACVCMGASISMTVGMEKARGREFAEKTVAIIGDSTFVHSGITGLINAVYNQATSTVIILDNGTTAMTGHQNHPATGITLMGDPTAHLDFEKLLPAIGVEHVRVVDPLDMTALEEVIREETARPETSVIITRRPCVLTKHHTANPYRFQIDAEACKGCKMCIKVGCTGISFDDETKKAVVNSGCIACGVCQQVCKFDAVKKVEA